jgi:hypothetical protein
VNHALLQSGLLAEQRLWQVVWKAGPGWAALGGGPLGPGCEGIYKKPGPVIISTRHAKNLRTSSSVWDYSLFDPIRLFSIVERFDCCMSSFGCLERSGRRLCLFV